MSGMISDTYSSAPPIAIGDREATYPILSHLTILRMRARGPRTLAKGHHIQSSVSLRYLGCGPEARAPWQRGIISNPQSSYATLTKVCVRCFIQFSKCSEPEHVEKLSRPYIFHIRSLRLSMRHLSWPTITNGKREVVCHDVCRRLCARYQSICPIYAHQA
jgi:hypothetical protein